MPEWRDPSLLYLLQVVAAWLIILEPAEPAEFPSHCTDNRSPGPGRFIEYPVAGDPGEIPDDSIEIQQVFLVPESVAVFP